MTMPQRYRRGTRHSAACACCALAFLALGAGQSQQPPTQPPADPQRPPAIRSGAELVRVDVNVINSKGLPVTSLTADDFEVREDGVPQAIQSFQFVAVNGHPEEGDDVSLPIRSRDHASAEAARDDVRVFLIFWDEYHINRMRSAMIAKEHLTRFVRRAFGPKDLVAFMDPLTPTEAIRFTRDRLALAETVRTLRGRSGVYVPARSVLEEAHMYSREGVERLRSQVTLTALKAAAAHLGALRQGRKSIIFISEGMRGLGRDEPLMIEDLIRTANDSNTAIYAINPLGLTIGRNPRFDMLQALSDNTGGESFATNDFERAMQRVVEQSSAFYLLGYAPAQRALDGKFHRIRVRVKQPGLEVRARAGYWAPTLRDMKRAEEQAAKTLPPAIADALADLLPATSRHTVDLWAGVSAGASGRPVVQLVWTPRRPAAGEPAIDVAGATAVATADAGTAFDGAVGAAGVSFEAAPGPLEITLDARNAAGDIVDRQVREIAIPDPARLWISSPAVIPTSTPLELRAARKEPGTVPTAAREFSGDERLLIRFGVSGADAPTVTARLLNNHGDSLTSLPVSRAHGGYELDIPLRSIARGDFLVGIQANAGSERADAYVPLRILR
jgi:VWFA-related protein